MPVQVLGADGTGTDADIINGLVYAVDHGADVVLMAFSNPGESPALQDAVNYAWSHGVVVVAAAGNDGSATPSYPAGLAKVVGVGSTDPADAAASFSNTSDAVFVTAPGTDIAASDASGTTSISGTSASAAIVAGSAALLKAEDSGASPATIVGRIARNTDAEHRRRRQRSHQPLPRGRRRLDDRCHSGRRPRRRRPRRRSLRRPGAQRDDRSRRAITGIGPAGNVGDVHGHRHGNFDVWERGRR